MVRALRLMGLTSGAFHTIVASNMFHQMMMLEASAGPVLVPAVVETNQFPIFSKICELKNHENKADKHQKNSTLQILIARRYKGLYDSRNEHWS
jgi:hypothetical protein